MAIMYSPQGGIVTVCRRAARGLLIPDRKIGIEVGYFDKIFELFERLHLGKASVTFDSSCLSNSLDRS
jgi:light-regulated signal transduction histidine kinase (bacteriophytochrome)